MRQADATRLVAIVEVVMSDIEFAFPGKCSECNIKAFAKGLCRTHYNKAWRNKRKTTNGKSSGRSPKLSESDVKQIKKLHAGFKSNREIARQFGVDQKLIQKVLKGDYKPRPD